jgi:hypothetical protein
MTVLHPEKDNPKGWHFVGPKGDERFPECRPDGTGMGARYLTEIYLAAEKDYTGSVSVPVLWVRCRAFRSFFLSFLCFRTCEREGLGWRERSDNSWRLRVHGM